jgi:uncharacterized SAM-binding protein YcdF (DUF218 family)
MKPRAIIARTARTVPWLALAAAALLHYVVLATLGDPWNFGTLLSLLAACIATSAFFLRRAGHSLLPTDRRIRTVALAAVGMTAAWYVGMCSWMFVEARSEEGAEIDVVLILGAGLKDGRPTPTLERRIHTALDFLLEHPEVSAVACGGVGPGQQRSEAEVIRNALVHGGVASNRILLEPRSSSTVENLRFALPLVRQIVPDGSPRVLLVTSNFHLARAKMLARNQGFVPYSLPASTPWYVLPNTTARESVAILKSVVVDLR